MCIVTSDKVRRRSCNHLRNLSAGVLGRGTAEDKIEDEENEDGLGEEKDGLDYVYIF